MYKSAKPGTVYLVGAGPGAADLITFRGFKLLRQADTVVYDRLIHPDLLLEAHPDADLVYVGKAPNSHTCSQEEINERLITAARKGDVVVRLKGGDPFVFGRGSEEGLALVQAGIPFEVVPGVTSAISVPAFAGIPVTHRGVSNMFTVITGHTCASESGGIDWDDLPKAGTLVILMGIGNLAEITQHLIEGGRSPETPVAIVRCGSTDEQQVTGGTLVEIVEKARGIRPPATIVVGEVVNLGHLLSWFDPEKVGEQSFADCFTRPTERAHKSVPPFPEVFTPFPPTLITESHAVL